MKNSEKYIKQFSHGTTTKTITKDDVRNIELPIHAKPYQDKVASILSTIDEKIFNNTKYLRELDKYIKFQYRYWFEYFNFPDSKSKPYRENNNKFKKSKSLGYDIPIEWEVVQVKDRFKFLKGTEIGAKLYKDIKGPNDVCFIRVSDLNSECNIYANKDLFIELLDEDDVCVSVDGTIGKVDFGLTGGYSSGIRKVIDNYEKINNAFIYAYLTSDYAQFVLEKYSTGSNILHASEAINNLYLPFNENVILKFQSLVEVPFKTMQLLKKELDNLKKTKELILPMLMNNQIKIV